MDTDELETFLEGGTETQSFEVKAAMNWNVTTLAKDILAMANVRDGGRILIGVEDGTFVRQGVSAEQKGTYDIDTMKDQMSQYADPSADFGVSFPKDHDGKEFIAITVRPFVEIPVICKKDSGDTKKGEIYYRNSSGRPQSSRVSNSYDMRDIIEVALARRSTRVQGLGLRVISTSDEAKFTDEREGL